MLTDKSRLLELAIFISCLLILVACTRSVQAQTVDTSGDFSHAHNTLLAVKPATSGLNMQSSPPPPTYDEQLAMTFTQTFTSLEYTFTAVPQVDSYGYGPAYLLNGLSNDGYWYQVGLSYDWPYQSGGYSSGFNFSYEVWDSSKNSVYPTNGLGLETFSGTVNPGDLVTLELYFNNGLCDKINFQ
jgi:hypothetical protein